jgi:hypothetical protein
MNSRGCKVCGLGGHNRRTCKVLREILAATSADDLPYKPRSKFISMTGWESLDELRTRPFQNRTLSPGTDEEICERCPRTGKITRLLFEFKSAKGLVWYRLEPIECLKYMGPPVDSSIWKDCMTDRLLNKTEQAKTEIVINDDDDDDTYKPDHGIAKTIDEDRLDAKTQIEDRVERIAGTVPLGLRVRRDDVSRFGVARPRV